MIFMHVLTVIQGGQSPGTSKSLTDKMRTVKRTKDIPVAKDSRFTSVISALFLGFQLLRHSRRANSSRLEFVQKKSLFNFVNRINWNFQNLKRFGTSIAIEMEGAEHARTSNTCKENQHALGWHGGGRSDNIRPCQWWGEETSASTYFWSLLVFFLSEECQHHDASFIASWCSECQCENTTSAPLIVPVVTIATLPLLYHVRTFKAT